MKKFAFILVTAVILCLNAAAAFADPIEVYFNDPTTMRKTAPSRT